MIDQFNTEEISECDGYLLLSSGNPRAASEVFARAFAANPWQSLWREQQIAALLVAGLMEEALLVVDRDLAERPGRPWLVRLRASVLLAMDDHAGARDLLTEIWRVAPDDDTAALLAESLLAGEEPALALEVLAAARVRDGLDPRLPLIESLAWSMLADWEAAARSLMRARSLGASASRLTEVSQLVGQQADQALVKGQLPLVAVRSLFDAYAGEFEVRLTGPLRYVAPQEVAGLVARAQGKHRAVTIELGCGTGLTGRLLRPLASELTGVDISPEMLSIARAAKVYDRLVLAEAVAWLQEQPEATAETIVAADVLVYVGDLCPLFAAVARCLREGGLFVVTAEKPGSTPQARSWSHTYGQESPGMTQPVTGFVLTEARRFAHSEAYLRETASTFGFVVDTLACFTPRWDRGLPVAGWLGLFRRFRTDAPSQSGHGLTDTTQL